MIRKILIPFRGDGKGENVLRHAAALAKRFKAHVEITHCRARSEDMMPFGVPIPGFLKKQFTEQAVALADAEEERLQTEVKCLVKDLKLKMTEKPTGRTASAWWVEEQGRQVDIIKRHGRLADVICVPKPDVDRNLGANTLKAALFNTGRPVMMCPETTDKLDDLGAHVTIAWNGSTEAARAVALCMGVIEKADQVTILTSGSEVHGAGTDELLAYLEMRGVKADVNKFKASKAVGNQLLALSQEVGADLMVMGAYSKSHEREVAFGGETQRVVDKATMPVILVH